MQLLFFGGRWADQWYHWASWLMEHALCQGNSIFYLLNEPLLILPIHWVGQANFCSCQLMAGPSPIHWVSPYLPLLHNFMGKVMSHFVFKPGARGQRPRAPGFLKLLWFARRCVCVCVCVCMCVSAPEAINNQWRDMV